MNPRLGPHRAPVSTSPNGARGAQGETAMSTRTARAVGALALTAAEPSARPHSRHRRGPPRPPHASASATSSSPGDRRPTNFLFTRAADGTVTVHDTKPAAMTAGTGCTQQDATTVRCSGVENLNVNGGGGDDSIDNDTGSDGGNPNVGLPSTLNGGDGNDLSERQHRARPADRARRYRPGERQRRCRHLRCGDRVGQRAEVGPPRGPAAAIAQLAGPPPTGQKPAEAPSARWQTARRSTPDERRDRRTPAGGVLRRGHKMSTYQVQKCPVRLPACQGARAEGGAAGDRRRRRAGSTTSTTRSARRSSPWTSERCTRWAPIR